MGEKSNIMEILLVEKSTDWQVICYSVLFHNNVESRQNNMVKSRIYNYIIEET